MNNDFIGVDELILEIADYKNDYADVAAEKLLRKCSTPFRKSFTVLGQLHGDE
jgi:hypothetical protein